MLENIKLNNVNNIVPVKASLSDINGEEKIYLRGDNVQGITSDESVRPYDQAFTVETITVDKYVQENNLNVGLIKVDVEGTEQRLLKGAIETIKSQKPILVFSIYHNPNDFFEIKPLIEKLDLVIILNYLKKDLGHFLRILFWNAGHINKNYKCYFINI